MRRSTDQRRQAFSLVRQVPRVKRGDPITAAAWNAMASAVDGQLAAPGSLDQGIEAVEVDIWDVKLVEAARTTETVRIENPDDAAQFVEVERAVRSLLVGADRTYLIEWDT